MGLAFESDGVEVRTVSQSDHHKLVDVARQIVDEAVRRARARGHDS